MATVRLAGAKLDPKFVSDLLDMQPEVAALKGKRLRPSSRSSKAVASTGTWFVSKSSDGQSPFQPLQDLVRLVDEKFDRLKTAIPDLSVSFTLLSLDEHYTENDLPFQLVTTAHAIGNLELSAG